MIKIMQAVYICLKTGKLINIEFEWEGKWNDFWWKKHEEISCFHCNNKAILYIVCPKI